MFSVINAGPVFKPDDSLIHVRCLSNTKSLVFLVWPLDRLRLEKFPVFGSLPCLYYLARKFPSLDFHVHRKSLFSKSLNEQERILSNNNKHDLPDLERVSYRQESSQYRFWWKISRTKTHYFPNAQIHYSNHNTMCFLLDDEPKTVMVRWTRK